MKNQMKMAAVFCVLVLGAALMANADTIPVTTTTWSGGVANGWTTGFSFTASVERTVGYKPGFDELVLTINSMTGVAAGSSIQAMEGTWSITGGTFDLASDSAVSAYNTDNGTHKVWSDFAANSGGPTAAKDLSDYNQTPTRGPLTYVNLPINGKYTFSRVGSGQAFTSFTGGWETGGATGVGAGGVLATIIVPTGWNGTITFDGPIGFSYGTGNTQNAEFSFTAPIPEPATLVLLSTGLLGLLAYAWRKRK
jgi:hypothetical protein